MRTCTGRAHGMAQEASHVPGPQHLQTFALHAAVCKGHLPGCMWGPVGTEAESDSILSSLRAQIRSIMLHCLPGGWQGRAPPPSPQPTARTRGPTAHVLV